MCILIFDYVRLSMHVCLCMYNTKQKISPRAHVINMWLGDKTRNQDITRHLPTCRVYAVHAEILAKGLIHEWVKMEKTKLTWVF